MGNNAICIKGDSKDIKKILTHWRAKLYLSLLLHLRNNRYVSPIDLKIIFWRFILGSLEKLLFDHFSDYINKINCGTFCTFV